MSNLLKLLINNVMAPSLPLNNQVVIMECCLKMEENLLTSVMTVLKNSISIALYCCLNFGRGGLEKKNTQCSGLFRHLRMSYISHEV